MGKAGEEDKTVAVMAERRPLRVGKATVLGDRANQQDALHCETQDEVLLAVVCDGMGGMNGGELASAEAIRTIFRRFHEDHPDPDQIQAEWMRSCMQQADAEVFALAGEAGKPLGGGSTCVLVLASQSAFQWCCVGDSRIILLREGTLYTLTRMHNYNLQLDEMVYSGRLLPEERQDMGAKGEALISFLGIGGLPLIDTGSDKIPWQRGDILILCSDGLYKALSDEQIKALAEECGGAPQVLAQRLCAHAVRLAKKKQDNTTVIVIMP